MGPTLSWRGSTTPPTTDSLPDARYYMDFTGCGNTCPDAAAPRVLQFIMDSLRYWVTEMHVDRFRFDLRQHPGSRTVRSPTSLGAFFDIVHQDAILSQVKLIAEPWDLGDGGYQVGNFPLALVEVERTKYRDNVASSGRAKGDGERVRHAAVAGPRIYRVEQPPALLEHQLHHLPRRVSLNDLRELRRAAAQRGQRREHPRRISDNN